jgi:hypothetical protein
LLGIEILLNCPFTSDRLLQTLKSSTDPFRWRIHHRARCAEITRNPNWASTCRADAPAKLSISLSLRIVSVSCLDPYPLFSFEMREVLSKCMRIMLARTSEVKFKLFIVGITDL